MDPPDLGREFFLKYPRNTRRWKFFSGLTMLGVGFISRVFVKHWHRTTVINPDFLRAALERAKAENRGIISVMNHVSILDDPLIWGGVLSLAQLGNPDRMRWALGAKDICFKNWKESLFFSLGQVLSVERFGRGPDQPAMDCAVGLVSQGKWVHLYPEGFVHQPYEPYEQTLRYFHWGVSRLVLEAGPNSPIVVPIYGKGLQQIFPEDKVKRTFGYGNKQPIVYSFGKPMDSDQISAFRKKWQAVKHDPTLASQLRSEVAHHIRQSVLKVKKEVNKELLDNDLDPRLGTAEFWKNQTLIRMKGRTMVEKQQKGKEASEK